MKTAHALAALIASTLALTPDLARACSDAGPPNRTNDGGPAWIACERHDDCPSDQRCGSTGWCFSGTCGGEQERCDETGCRCCADPEDRYWETCGPPRFLCEGSGVDAGASADAEAAQNDMDAGVSAPEPHGEGCSVGTRGAGAPAWLAALALSIALAARRRAR